MLYPYIPFLAYKTPIYSIFSRFLGFAFGPNPKILLRIQANFQVPRSLLVQETENYTNSSTYIK